MEHLPGVPAKLTLPGTRRAVGFAKTIERAEAAAGRVGITRVADVTGLDHLGLPLRLGHPRDLP